MVIGAAIVVLGLALIPVQRRWAYNFQLIEYNRFFWMTMVVVFLASVAAAEIAWRTVLKRTCKLALLVGFAMAGFSYNVFYPIVNGAFDRRPAQQRVYTIESRFCYRGPELRLVPADQSKSGGFRLRVRRTYCRGARDGQELIVDVQPGFLNTPWASRYELRP